jgi:hypothetical protein
MNGENMKNIKVWMAASAKAIRIIPALLLTGAALTSTGCATGGGDYVPNDEAMQRMKPVVAREYLNKVHGGSILPTGCGLCSYDTKLRSMKVFNDRIEAIGEDGRKFTFPLNSLVPEVDALSLGSGIELILDKKWRLWTPATEVEDMDTYKKIADALFVLKNNSSADHEATEEADFDKAINDHRKATSKEAFPEAARKFKVQAEDALNDKKFEDAADFYAEALKLAPWWPEGHFNRALVLAESGNYEIAIREMKRYLIIVPNASDARAAQDKIYDWERRAGK